MPQKLLTDIPGVTKLLEFFGTSLTEEQYGEFIDLLLDIFPDCEFMPDPPGMASDTQMKGTTVDKMAFDAAMHTAFSGAADAAIRKIQAIAQAERDVKPYVGEIIGMDSAGAVYREALKTLGHNTAAVPLSAMSSMFHALKSGGARRIAMDASTTTDLEKLVGPGVSALKRR